MISLEGYRKVARGIEVKILCCGFAEQKPQQRLQRIARPEPNENSILPKNDVAKVSP